MDASYLPPIVAWNERESELRDVSCSSIRRAVTCSLDDTLETYENLSTVTLELI